MGFWHYVSLRKEYSFSSQTLHIINHEKFYASDKMDCHKKSGFVENYPNYLIGIIET